jgi:hypothetical protein
VLAEASNGSASTSTSRKKSAQTRCSCARCSSSSANAAKSSVKPSADGVPAAPSSRSAAACAARCSAGWPIVVCAISKRV